MHATTNTPLPLPTPTRLPHNHKHTAHNYIPWGAHNYIPWGAPHLQVNYAAHASRAGTIQMQALYNYAYFTVRHASETSCHTARGHKQPPGLLRAIQQLPRHTCTAGNQTNVLTISRRAQWGKKLAPQGCMSPTCTNANTSRALC
jgi:hypothetical protein